MTKAGIVFSKKDEYYTPKYIVDYFGKFDYDPATTEEKAEELGIKNYDTIKTNGLNSDWSIYKKVWVNPPFTKKEEFIKKAYDTYLKNPYIYIYILFPIEFLTTKSFSELSKGLGGKIYIPKGRICFEEKIGQRTKGVAFGSVIMKIQDKWEIEFMN